MHNTNLFKVKVQVVVNLKVKKACCDKKQQREALKKQCAAFNEQRLAMKQKTLIKNASHSNTNIFS